MSVVVVSRDRRASLLRTLGHLTALPERPPVIVVDNGSTDGSAEAVRDEFAGVEVIELGENRGSAGRTVGVQAATTPYVAFADDDSWWAPGSLTTAASHFDRHPSLGLIAARILVGPEERLDPVCVLMADSPLPQPSPPLPGPPVLGFVACGAVVRREAYLAVGGFSDLLFFLCEERLLAWDLAAAGWDLAYTPDVVAHHHPGAPAPGPGRRIRIARNDLLCVWLRRPLGVVAAQTALVAVRGARDPVSRRALAGVVRRAPSVLAGRRRLPALVEARVRLLEGVRAQP